MPLSHDANIAADVSIRLHDELARGSRAGTGTAAGRNMQPVAMAESVLQYGATFANNAGTVTETVGLGYGLGDYEGDFAYQ